MSGPSPHASCCARALGKGHGRTGGKATPQPIADTFSALRSLSIAPLIAIVLTDGYVAPDTADQPPTGHLHFAIIPRDPTDNTDSVRGGLTANGAMKFATEGSNSNSAHPAEFDAEFDLTYLPPLTSYLIMEQVRPESTLPGAFAFQPTAQISRANQRMRPMMRISSAVRSYSG